VRRVVRRGLVQCALGLIVGNAEPLCAQEAAATQATPAVQAPAAPPSGQDPARPDDADQQKARPVGFQWNKGLSLRLGEAGHIDFKARLQADFEDTDGPTADTDASWDVARRRIGIEGELFDLLEFQIERELTGDDEPWRDVYVNVRAATAVQVQGGQFKLPFSLDENTSSTNLDFVYRSLATRQLAPGRDPGVMVHGRVLPRRMLRYEAGVFHEDGRNARTSSATKVWGGTTGAARLVVQPWRTLQSALEDFQIGVAATRSDVPEGIPALRGEAVLGEPFYDPETPVLGMRRRTGVEARWRPGPFSVKSEYMRVTTAREEQSLESTDLSPLLGSGWYVSGTWAITGERKARGLDEPRRPMFQGGIGAIELAARTEALDFRSTGDGEPSDSPRADMIPPIADRVFTFGVNWYVNRYVKIQANVVRESFSDPERSPRPGDAVIVSTLLRLQLTI
jgi:phosphate-selective porin OprO/OprP